MKLRSLIVAASFSSTAVLAQTSSPTHSPVTSANVLSLFTDRGTGACQDISGERYSNFFTSQIPYSSEAQATMDCGAYCAQGIDSSFVGYEWNENTGDIDCFCLFSTLPSSTPPYSPSPDGNFTQLGNGPVASVDPSVVPPSGGKCYSYNAATFSPTLSPTSANPTTAPTVSPSVDPTTTPSASPSSSPSSSPSLAPSSSPTNSPTTSPSVDPTMTPSASPSSSPTLSPSLAPSSSPTNSPTTSPMVPTVSPSMSPNTASPSTSPTSGSISLYTDRGAGYCSDSMGRTYYSYLRDFGPYYSEHYSRQICANWCAQDLRPESVGFSVENSSGNALCFCLYSGGILNQSPNLNPPYTNTISGSGDGPVASVGGSIGTCYSLKSATFAPTPSPTVSPSTPPTASLSPTTSPSVSPIHFQYHRIPVKNGTCIIEKFYDFERPH